MKTLDVWKIKSELHFIVTTPLHKTSIMLKFITITLLLGAATAAPSGLYLARVGLPEAPASTIHATHIAPLAYVPAPLTYAEPATLTKYESISSPLTYTASHQPAVALTNSLGYAAYNGYAGYPIHYNGLGFAY